MLTADTSHELDGPETGMLVQAAWRRRHAVRRIAQARLSAQADVDDVWSDVLLKAHLLDAEARYGQLSSGHADALIVRIATQRASNCNRSRSTATRYGWLDWTSTESLSDPADILERHEFVSEVLEHLGEDAELVVDQACGLTSDESARHRRRVTAAAVRQRVSRGLSEVRAELSPRWGGGVPAIAPLGRIRNAIQAKAELWLPALPSLATGVLVGVLGGLAAAASSSPGGLGHQAATMAQGQTEDRGAAVITLSPRAELRDQKVTVAGRSFVPRPHHVPSGAVAGSGVEIGDPETGRSAQGRVGVPDGVPLIGGKVILWFTRPAQCDGAEQSGAQAVECQSAEAVDRLLDRVPGP